MVDLSYIKGRLEGLFELVSLLRETVKEGEATSPKLVERLVEHIYAELEEILDNLGASTNVQERATALKKKIDEAKAKKASGGAVQSYDVLSEILKKGQQG